MKHVCTGTCIEMANQKLISNEDRQLKVFKIQNNRYSENSKHFENCLFYVSTRF